jgi:parallel beta-helix repeat protein
MRLRAFFAGCAVALFLSGSLFAGSDKEATEKAVSEKNVADGKAAEKAKKGKKTDRSRRASKAKPAPEGAGTAQEPSATTSPSGETTPADAAKESARGFGTIRGRVLNEGGLPVRGADVACIDEKGTMVAETFTDEDGMYEFSGLQRGEYTISVRSRGTAGPVEVRFPDSPDKPPAPPSKLGVRELDRDYMGKSAVRVEWERVKGASNYRCELYVKGRGSPLAQRSDMIQTFCEFEDLDEDSEYEVRVYSKNEAGVSERYASTVVRTAFRPPPPPTGLGVTYAKNNKVDLSWNAGAGEMLRGYAIQIAKDTGSYLYYTPQGLTSDRSKAYLVELPQRGEVMFSIEGASLVQNLVPYSFRVLAVDRRGIFSKASSPVKGIVLQDTVPPRPPVDLKYEITGENKLRVSWKAADRDVVRYRVSYGFDRDRWDSVVFTEKTSYELVFNRAQLRDKELFVNITAVDRAGNESGIRPIEKKETVTRGETDAGDIVVTSKDIYKDYSSALRPSARTQRERTVAEWKPERRDASGRTIGFAELRAAGFSVGRGVTARIGGKVRMPENAFIRVMAGGSLVLDGAELEAESGLWGGIRFVNGSYGVLRNSVISKAAIGVAIVNNDGGVRVSNLQVFECAENGVRVEGSRVELSFLALQKNRIGLFVENGAVTLVDSSIRLNEKGVLANNYSLAVLNTKIEGNREYGLRLYGGGRVERCVFRDNLVGIVLEKGRGSARVTGCRVELNTMDGIVSNALNADIAENLIASNGRHGIYLREGANPNISGNDIVNNRAYAVFGGGRVARSYVAYNNGSPYYDDTEERGKPDNVFSSSSSGPVKQIEGADYIVDLSFSSVLR